MGFVQAALPGLSAAAAGAAEDLVRRFREHVPKLLTTPLAQWQSAADAGNQLRAWVHHIGRLSMA
jgi:hypothetical protein